MNMDLIAFIISFILACIITYFKLRKDSNI
jgi:hypothetical protein